MFSGSPKRVCGRRVPDMEKYIVCLCDLTGHLAAPWVKAGYTAVLVDPQLEDSVEPGWIRLGCRIEDCFQELALILATRKVRFVAGFPPCTDVSVSGARWWEEKRKADPYFQARAAIVAEQCRMFGVLSCAPWMFENPVSAFSSIFGNPDHSFHPWEYTAYCSEDNYVKQTCLWTGNGFKMPARRSDPTLGTPDTRIWTAPPSEERANFRSATPKGFAQALFEVHHASRNP